MATRLSHCAHPREKTVRKRQGDQPGTAKKYGYAEYPDPDRQLPTREGTTRLRTVGAIGVEVDQVVRNVDRCGRQAHRKECLRGMGPRLYVRDPVGRYQGNEQQQVLDPLMGAHCADERYDLHRFIVDERSLNRNVARDAVQQSAVRAHHYRC
jgi:hypothetical protein